MNNIFKHSKIKEFYWQYNTEDAMAKRDITKTAV
jgi:hypothetical protein